MTTEHEDLAALRAWLRRESGVSLDDDSAYAVVAEIDRMMDPEAAEAERLEAERNAREEERARMARVIAKAQAELDELAGIPVPQVKAVGGEIEQGRIRALYVSADEIDEDAP